MTMTAGIALGSNLEPRFQNLQKAVQRLTALHATTTPLLCSRVYQTHPVDCPKDSPPFLNAVAEIQTTLDPETLLTHLQAIEIDLGRPAIHAKNSPRPIDLDLLYCDNMTLSSPTLTLPHPRMTQRLFVLKPLADLRPDLVLPGETLPVGQLARKSFPNEDTIYFEHLCLSI